MNEQFARLFNVDAAGAGVVYQGKAYRDAEMPALVRDLIALANTSGVTDRVIVVGAIPSSIG